MSSIFQRFNAPFQNVQHPLCESLARLALDLDPRLRVRTVPILDRHDLVCALLARQDAQGVLVAPLAAHVQDDTLAPALLRVGRAGIRELEGRDAAELERDLSVAALVNVNVRLLAG